MRRRCFRATHPAFVVASLVGLAGCSETPDTWQESARSTSGASKPYLHVEVVEDRVTVEARHVTVRDLLQEIGHQSGFKVVSHEPLQESITVEFHQLPLPEAVDRILGDRSFNLRYVESSTRDSSDARPGKLWVFSPTDDQEDSSDITSAIDALRMEQMDADSARRREAVAGLGELQVDEAVAPLTLALADADATVRLEAVSALAHIGSDQAVAALAAAVSDPDSSVREEAVDALGEAGGETAIPALEQALLDPQSGIRLAAIEALVEVGGDRSALALGVALNDENPSVREEAVDALGEIGGDAAITLLQQALADEQSQVREAAAEMLAELSGQEQ